MKNSVRIIAAAAALAACGLVSAQSAGSWLARVGVTHLSPDVSSGNLSAPSFPNTKVDSKSDTQLGGGITYMLTDNLAVDVPLATPFKHDLAQLGFVYNFNERWFVDASYSKSFLKTKIHLSSGQSINVKLDPNVFALAVGYRF